MNKVCVGPITSGFGNRIHPKKGIKHFHNGVDIGCDVGTPVLAPTNCIVAQVYTDTEHGGGKTIILRDSENNDRYGFCHLDEQLVKVGSRVAQGSVIAKSGNTGLGTGPHLHFSYATGGYWKEGMCKGCIFEDPTTKINIEP